MEKIKNFFEKNIFTKILGKIVVIALIVFLTIVLLLWNMFLSLIIEYDNPLHSNLVATIGLTGSIVTIMGMFMDTNEIELKKIKKQNEEMKAELEEIKKIVQEEPKEYKIDVKVIT